MKTFLSVLFKIFSVLFIVFLVILGVWTWLWDYAFPGMVPENTVVIIGTVLGVFIVLLQIVKGIVNLRREPQVEVLDPEKGVYRSRPLRSATIPTRPKPRPKPRRGQTIAVDSYPKTSPAFPKFRPEPAKPKPIQLRLPEISYRLEPVHGQNLVWASGAGDIPVTLTGRVGTHKGIEYYEVTSTTKGFEGTTYVPRSSLKPRPKPRPTSPKTTSACPKCGSLDTKPKGYGGANPRWECLKCGQIFT